MVRAPNPFGNAEFMRGYQAAQSGNPADPDGGDDYAMGYQEGTDNPSPEENLGDRITRISREQNVSYASAARAARATMRLDEKLRRRRK